jgi:hypothetical protein
MRFEVDSSVQEEAELFFTELVGASATRSTSQRPEPRARPQRVAVTTAPTLPVPASISAETITDAAAYLVDPDRAVASQSITPQRVHVTKAWLAANPMPQDPIRVASREDTSTGRDAMLFDRLVDGLVLAGFPLSMWAATIATVELSGPDRELARELGSRPQAPVVRTWLQRAADLAELAWNDARVAEILAGIATAARASTARGVAVAACARLAHASHRLLAAFATPAARASAATFVARLPLGERAALPFLVTASEQGIELVRSRITGGNAAIPPTLRGQATRLAERVQAVHRHLRVEVRNDSDILDRW